MDGKPFAVVWAHLAGALLTFTSGLALSFYNQTSVSKVPQRACDAQQAFYGWKIVFLMCIESASTAVSIFFLSGGFTGLYVAKLVQDYDPRVSITLGALMASLSLCALPFVANLVQLFAVYVVFGAGFAASALIPATTFVTRWFRRRRAVALSVASTGLSLGGVVLTPLSALMIDTLGFRLAMPLLALLFVVGVIPVALIWLRPDPESMGLLPDGDSTMKNDDDSEQKPAAESARAVGAGLYFSTGPQETFFWGNQPGLHLYHAGTSRRNSTPVWSCTGAAR